jgi:hypothetical protein
MRRWIAILLLTLLPFQFSWSAAAVHCEHETGAAAQHFGHHFHSHTSTAKGQHESSSTLKADGDCPECAHLANSVPLPAAMPVVRVPASRDPPATVVAGSPPSAPPSRPERPNWSAPV